MQKTIGTTQTITRRKVFNEIVKFLPNLHISIKSDETNKSLHHVSWNTVDSVGDVESSIIRGIKEVKKSVNNEEFRNMCFSVEHEGKTKLIYVRDRIG